MLVQLREGFTAGFLRSEKLTDSRQCGKLKTLEPGKTRTQPRLLENRKRPGKVAVGYFIGMSIEPRSFAGRLSSRFDVEGSLALLAGNPESVLDRDIGVLAFSRYSQSGSA